MSIIAEALKRAEREKGNTISSRDYLNKILGPERKQAYHREADTVIGPSGRGAMVSWSPAGYFKEHKTLAFLGLLLAVTIVFLTAANIFVVYYPGINRIAREGKPALTGEPLTAEAYTEITPELEKVLAESSIEKVDAEFMLNGIVWDIDDPWAVINNKVIRTGEVIEGAKIVSIDPQEVVILFRDKTFSLKVK